MQNSVLVRASIHDALRLVGQRADAKGYFRCPSHDDKNPSAHIVKEGGWTCFACGAKGGILDLIIASGMASDYRDAARTLDDFLGGTKPEPSGQVQRPIPKTRPEQIPASIGFLEHLGAKLDYLTEVDAGILFAKLYERSMRYCSAAGGWFLWNDQRWQHDPEGAIVFEAAEDCVRFIASLADGCTDLAEKKRLIDFACSLRRRRVLENMMVVANKQSEIHVSDPNVFDANPWLFNVENGTIDLRTGQLLFPRRENLLTKLVPIEYDPDAECPRWEKFLREIFAGDHQTIDFVQRAVGYTLTGLNKEHCLFVLHGIGHNGKSTFVKTLAQIVGEYGKATSSSTFVDRQAGAQTNDLAALKGARFVSSVETSDRAHLAENFVKAVTGGDRISARFLHEEFFEYEPVFKIWLATNHKPTIKGTDLGIWRRIRLIPFTQSFEGLQDDRNLRDKLDLELPGILTWAVRGCLLWQYHGLQPSESVTNATASYRTEQDTFAGFLAEKCEIDPEVVTPMKDLYQAYKSWAEESGERPQSKKWVGNKLSDRGFDTDRTKADRLRKGLRLI